MGPHARVVVVAFALGGVFSGCSASTVSGGGPGGAECVPACTVTQHCVSGACVDLADHCSNGTEDSTETGVDCGGADCLACSQAACTSGATCASGVCTGGQCADPTCDDGVQNGDETGLDCGGSCAASANATCTAGGGCRVDADCESLVCGAGGACSTPPCQCQAATCFDGVKNGLEKAVDCGGDCAAGCANGTPCDVAGDCTSEVCAGTCQPSCLDGVKSQDETDVDCGGLTCGPCAAGKSCGGPADCQSLVCTAGTCQVATCTDGVQNQGESDVDCGGPCPPCLDGLKCGEGTDCASGVCGVSNVCALGPCACQVASCADTVQNHGETDVDCGGPCTPCADGKKCVLGQDCVSLVCDATDTCAYPVCGDGVKNGTEVCDGTDFGGDTCAKHGFSTGTLTCNACTSIGTGSCSGFCGDGNIAGTEQCDGSNLGGKECPSLGLSGTGLSCNGDCTFNTSACGPATGCPPCPPTATCSPSYTCQCPIYQTLCGTSPGVCTSLLTDPQNCGACGTVCPVPATACSSGQCMSTCSPPLTKCLGECVDFLADNVHCGGCPGVDCTATGQVCSGGACVTPAATPTPPAKCDGGGPPIDLNIGTDTPLPDPQKCAGDLASVSFRWALCSCADVHLNQTLFTDGFDSSHGPYAPTCEGVLGGTACTQSSQWTSPDCTAPDSNGDALVTCVGQAGAGIGANGQYYDNQTTVDWGALWWKSASTPNIGTASVQQDIYAGSDLPGKQYGRADAWVAGNVSATGRIAGDLHIPAGHTVAAGFTVGGSKVDEAVDFQPPCDCTSSNLVPVVSIINAHACTGAGNGVQKCAGDTAVNDNFVANLSPDVFASGGGRVDLPCGMYYFSSIQGQSDTTIVAHGNVAIFVGGSVGSTNGSGNINFELSDSAELDIFVKGGLCNNSEVRVGSANYPARTRMYIAGGTLSSPTGGSGTTCSGTAARSMDVKTLKAAANFYAPWGKLYAPQPVLIYGSLFTGNYDISQTTTIHFDTAIVKEANQCGTGGGGSTCTSCRDCKNQACIGGVCGQCYEDGDCCAPLVCVLGSCVLY